MTRVEYKRGAGPIVVGKSTAAQSAAGRTVSGWITTFGLPADHAGDVIDEHAVDRYLAEHGNLLPALSAHDPEQMIGWHTLSKRQQGGVSGVWTDMTFLDGITRANEDLIRVRSGAMAFSIGFITNREEIRQGYRWILDMDLLEASVVLLPMNPRATIEARSDARLRESLERLRSSLQSAVRAAQKPTSPRSHDSVDAKFARISDLLKKLAA